MRKNFVGKLYIATNSHIFRGSQPRVWSGAAPHAFDTHEKSSAWTLLPPPQEAQQRATHELGATVTRRMRRSQGSAARGLPCHAAALPWQFAATRQIACEAKQVQCLCACRITGQAVNRDEAHVRGQQVTPTTSSHALPAPHLIFAPRGQHRWTATQLRYEFTYDPGQGVPRESPVLCSESTPEVYIFNRIFPVPGPGGVGGVGTSVPLHVRKILVDRTDDCALRARFLYRFYKNEPFS